MGNLAIRLYSSQTIRGILKRGRQEVRLAQEAFAPLIAAHDMLQDGFIVEVERVELAVETTGG